MVMDEEDGEDEDEVIAMEIRVDVLLVFACLTDEERARIHKTNIKFLFLFEQKRKKHNCTTATPHHDDP